MPRRRYQKRKATTSAVDEDCVLIEPSTSTGIKSHNRKKQKILDISDSADPKVQELILLDCQMNHKRTMDSIAEMKGTVNRDREKIDNLLVKYGVDPAADDNLFLKVDVDKIVEHYEKELLPHFRSMKKILKHTEDDLFSDDDEEKKKRGRDDGEDEGKACSICLDVLKTNLYATTCGHVFHEACIKKSVKMTKNCPICRKKISSKLIHPIFI